MLEEALSAPDAVARQLAADPLSYARLGQALQEQPPASVLTIARGSSERQSARRECEERPAIDGALRFLRHDNVLEAGRTVGHRDAANRELDSRVGYCVDGSRAVRDERLQWARGRLGDREEEARIRESTGDHHGEHRWETTTAKH